MAAVPAAATVAAVLMRCCLSRGATPPSRPQCAGHVMSASQPTLRRRWWRLRSGARATRSWLCSSACSSPWFRGQGMRATMTRVRERAAGLRAVRACSAPLPPSSLGLPYRARRRLGGGEARHAARGEDAAPRRRPPLLQRRRSRPPPLPLLLTLPRPRPPLQPSQQRDCPAPLLRASEPAATLCSSAPTPPSPPVPWRPSQSCGFPQRKRRRGRGCGRARRSARRSYLPRSRP